jgi:hypothetical protein
MSELTEDFRDFLYFLGQHQVRYLVAGGFATALHGHPRYTKDLGIWLEVAPENAVRVLKALKDFGFESVGLTEADFLDKGLVIQLGYEPNRIDLLTSLTGVTFDDSYPKRLMVKLGDLEIPVMGKQSLIENKRALGRSRDLADVDTLEQ